MIPVVSPMRSPSVTVWIVAALVAVALGGYTYRISIQVPDSLELIQEMHALPSPWAAFAEGLHSSSTILRPLRQLQTKLLLEASAALGGRYHLVFRGYHVALIAALLALFVVIARVNSWTDAAAAIIGLTVLIGMHTFTGFLRESYPVNHFLLIAVYALATLALAFTRGGWAADAAALVLAVLALLTLESGVLLWVVAVAAYASGLRGISWRAIAAISLLCVGYVVLRDVYLQMDAPGLGNRPTAFGITELSPAEQIARFGANPLRFYAYNSGMSILSVLVSQPRSGRWTIAEEILQGRVAPVFYVAILSSIAATTLIAWYAGSRDERGRRRWREPIPFVFLAVLLANGAISYAYTKNEIVSLSGVMYALAVTVALRPLLSKVTAPGIGVALTTLLLLFSTAWAWRAAALQTVLLRAAFSSKVEWTGVLMPGDRSTWPGESDTIELTARLKREAVSQRSLPPDALPRWVREWWGEE
jgi:hypothetical protein